MERMMAVRGRVLGSGPPLRGVWPARVAILLWSWRHPGPPPSWRA